MLLLIYNRLDLDIDFLTKLKIEKPTALVKY